MSEIVRRADIAEYQRPPIAEEARGTIKVRLLNATPDPLGSLAALCAQYTGRVVRSLDKITDEERRQALEDMRNTVLNGPLEVVQFHWQIEGVTRSITHQMVRSRASFFAQESLRFAVADDWAHEVPLPPSLAGDPDSLAAVAWRKAMVQAEDNYNALVAMGLPAEEARGVLPHDIPTRLHWVMDLRTLLADAGKRTCTQAQFPWRLIFAGMAKELRERAGQEYYLTGKGFSGTGGYASNSDAWQFRAIADLLRPVCYQTGSCGFMAKFDRGCTIRERVDLFARHNVPSDKWSQGVDLGLYRQSFDDRPEAAVQVRLVEDSCHHHTERLNLNGKMVHGHGVIPAIHDHEWAADPGAARVYAEVNTQEPCDICAGMGCPDCEAPDPLPWSERDG